MTRRISLAARLVRTLAVSALVGLPVLARAQGADEAAGKLSIAPMPVAQVQPSYPGALAERKVEGEVVASFVVDEKGRPDMSSFVVLAATHAQFVDAVRDAVSRSLYAPGIADGERVAAAVEQKFVFQLRGARAVASRSVESTLASR